LYLWCGVIAGLALMVGLHADIIGIAANWAQWQSKRGGTKFEPGNFGAWRKRTVLIGAESESGHCRAPASYRSPGL
jgi:hypothetical protein